MGGLDRQLPDKERDMPFLPTIERRRASNEEAQGRQECVCCSSRNSVRLRAPWGGTQLGWKVGKRDVSVRFR